MQKTLPPYFGPASKPSITILEKVAAFVYEFSLLTNWNIIEYQGWRLPAVLDPHSWCGIWTTLGCLNVRLHTKLGKRGFVYIKQFQRSCYRASCKTCYVKWIARSANRATRRIEQYCKEHPGKKPIHLILIPPKNQHDLPLKILRQRMSCILKIAEIEGAAVIFHPFRYRKEISQWYVWPHFHLVGFGSKDNIAKAFGKYGWYIKDEGVRESGFQTFCYILSHCGVKKGYQTITWFGNLSYSKLHVEKEPKITKCPVCAGQFHPVYNESLFHPVVPPNKPYEGLVDPEGWHLAETVNVWYQKDYRYDYAPFRYLDEMLKALSEAN